VCVCVCVCVTGDATVNAQLTAIIASFKFYDVITTTVRSTL